MCRAYVSQSAMYLFLLLDNHSDAYTVFTTVKLFTDTGSSPHLAACGSSIKASITWETSKQLCCCLDRWLKKTKITAKEIRHKKKKTEAWWDRGLFKDTAPRCEGSRNRHQTKTGVSQRSERQDFWTHPCTPSSETHQSWFISLGCTNPA